VTTCCGENHSYDQIIGATDAPYLNHLATQHGLATNFHAESHPSLPNYIALTSGSTQGIGDDDPPSAHPLDVPSIFGLLPGGASRSLEESMPSNCAQTDSGGYAVRHNPQAYYVNLAGDCAQYRGRHAIALQPVGAATRAQVRRGAEPSEP
jgi:phosphatidylinositol-3-phosphatase